MLKTIEKFLIGIFRSNNEMKGGSTTIRIIHNTSDQKKLNDPKNLKNFIKKEDTPTETEEDTFEIVMEDIISQVNDYRYSDYKKGEENG